MKVQPDFRAFAANFASGKPGLVWSTFVYDCETPVSAMLKLADGKPMSFLFESVEGGTVLGRYSFIGIKPDLIWRAHRDTAEINRFALTDPDSFVPCQDMPLNSLRALIKESTIPIPDELPPMAAGLFGYLGYDTIRWVEKIPDTNHDALDIPDAILVRPTIIAVFDNIARTVTVITPVRPVHGLTPTSAYDLARERLSNVIADLKRCLPDIKETTKAKALAEPVSNTPRARYLEMVEIAKDYITAGDVFQVVPSQRFSVPFPLSPLSLYRALRRLNPSPFLFVMNFGQFATVGSSPEILVRLRGGRVAVRPIAGTRPRGTTVAEDHALAADLLADPKERAEHLMLLDLARNDVGRVAKIGSVEVTESCQIENYSHVMHIVSHVEGTLRADCDILDALMAGFPAGTVSGAPKVRAMEIIDELETERRGLYAGCVGYFGAGGDMDTCIVLRTGLIKDGTLYVQAGGGVVYDSDPEAEFVETQNKAKALIRAAEEAIALAVD
ncbi:MAG: anthranilate synthase component I [Pseudomonadota bacterium]|nr:anthranilate synthase component I [Pseudomonadota bacterium]